jgi:hypothetical protein
MVRVAPIRTLSALLSLGLLAAACSSDDQPPQSTCASGNTSGMVAQAASVDLYVGDPQRVDLGLFTPENCFVSFGTVDVSFSLLGDAAQTSEQPGPTATAVFVPTFGMPDRSSPPVMTQPDEGRGVYEATGVVFDSAGVWLAEVTADVEGLGPQTAQATFAVQERPTLPAPGDRAQPTKNLTVNSKGVPLAAIDSRAASTDTIPDPGLHRWTIARAIAEGRPALVVFATPVFCVSKFCGPVTDMVEDLSSRYDDRAVFIHVEIWRDFENQVLNRAAVDWLWPQRPNGDLTEPWLFLIGADGRIVDRWSSMWSEREVETDLEALPPMKG